MIKNIFFIFFLLSCSQAQVKSRNLTQTSFGPIPEVFEEIEVGGLKYIKEGKTKVHHLSATSGLQFDGENFLAIADDELFLGILKYNKETRHLEIGRPLNLFPTRSALPKNENERKKIKPDLESLVYLGSQLYLAIPSGSTENRNIGVLIDLHAMSVQEVNFTPLYKEIKRNYFSELNIEGAALYEDTLFILQRGNGSTGTNGLIQLNYPLFLQQIKNNGTINRKVINKAQEIFLGKFKKVQLSFSDLFITEDGNMFFLATAEDNKSTYTDGEFKGSVLGMLTKLENEQFAVKWNIPFKKKIKAEGIWIEAKSDLYQVYFVTDNDNREVSGKMYQLDLPQSWTK